MRTIQIIRNMALAAAAMIAIGACSDDLVKENEPAAPQAGTITLTQGDVTDTRLDVTDEMTGDGERLSVKWKTGDMAEIGRVKTSGLIGATTYGSRAITGIADEGKTATISTLGITFDSEYTYKIFTGATNNLSTSFTQTGNNNTDHLGALAMVGDYEETEPNTIKSVAMKHLMSVLKFVFVLPESADVPDKVVVTGESSLTPFVSYFSYNNYLEETNQIMGATISLNLDLDALPADRTLTVYVPIMQVNPINEALKVVLEKEGGELYSFEQSFTGSPRTFAPGKIYTNTLVFEDAITARIAQTFDNNVVMVWSYERGDGTSSNPFVISSPAQLLYLAKQGFAASADNHYSLATDIHITADEWPGIGTFQGVFHGNGHVISGKMVKETGSDFGFFKSVSGTVENLHITASVTSGASTVGAIAGRATGTITGCTNWGAVTGTYSVGGITGIGSHGTFTSCTNHGAVTGTSTQYGYIGGIAGRAEVLDDTNVVFTACENYGALKGWDRVGGIVGEFGAFSHGSRATIHDSHNYATSIVTTTTDTGNEYAGKLVGGNYGTIYSCCTSVDVPGVTYMYGHSSSGSPGNTLTPCGTSH